MQELEVLVLQDEARVVDLVADVQQMRNVAPEADHLNPAKVLDCYLEAKVVELLLVDGRPLSGPQVKDLQLLTDILSENLLVEALNLDDVGDDSVLDAVLLRFLR